MNEGNQVNRIFKIIGDAIAADIEKVEAATAEAEDDDHRNA